MRASLTIAGIEVALQVPACDLEDVIADRYAPFLGAVSDPVCSLRLEPNGAVKGEDNPPLCEVGGAGGTDITLDHPDFTGSIDLEGDGTLSTATNPFTVDHAFRVLFGLLAPRHGAVMIHSCGVISQGEAHVFAGESGAGKSTLASLAGNRPLLSDEHVMIRQRDRSWSASSTPFWGSYAKPGAARFATLARLWSLVQWPSNEVHVKDAEHTLRTLLDNAVLPCSDPKVKAMVFDVAVEIAAAVPSAELRFAQDERVWEVIDARAAA